MCYMEFYEISGFLLFSLTYISIQCLSGLGNLYWLSYKQCFTDALAYVDDVTIICPSLRGLNKMLEICNEYAAANHIYFNSMKTVCIKYGDPVMEYEKLC